jgi:hypothetical protein
MSNGKAITALQNEQQNSNNSVTKSQQKRQEKPSKRTKIADTTMKSNPVAEFAHEHYGLEFATHTAFLRCSARLDRTLSRICGSCMVSFSFNRNHPVVLFNIQ